MPVQPDQPVIVSDPIKLAKAAAQAMKHVLPEQAPAPKHKGSPPADIVAAMPARARKRGVQVRRRSSSYAQHLNKIAEIAKKR